MNNPKNFLHNHPLHESKLCKDNYLNEKHVIVDREDWEQFMKVPSLPVQFYRWMQKNDTEENAERFANYDDEDMFRAFLIEEILLPK